MKANYNKHIKNIVLIIVGSTLISTLFSGFEISFKELIYNSIYGSAIGISIALGCGFITRKVFAKANFMQNPFKIFTLLLLGVAAYILIDVTIINTLWISLTRPYSLSQIVHSSFWRSIIISELFIGMMIFAIIISKRFIKELVNSEKMVQQVKQEALKSQYETLKFQVNPHFLFNSLNVLSSLIHTDVEKADEFTLKLADIYRYVLEHQDDEVVCLRSEMTFLQQYTSLQSIRFENNFTLKIEEMEKYLDKMIIPLSTQIIFENIFKHNIIAETNKMEISIEVSQNGEFLIISNTVNKKAREVISHKIGIKNIKQRYALLTDKNIFIEENNNKFIVKLPLLTVEN